MKQTRPPQPTRRQVLTAAGLSAAAVTGLQTAAPPARAATWRLHADTALSGQGKLYSGSTNRSQPRCDTAASSDCPGPGALSVYWGGLYVHSTASNMLRTGPFTSCAAPFPGQGTADRVRWASARAWRPEYRFAGRILVRGISPHRPDPWTGLVFHPVHITNCDNYWIRIWERDQPRLTFGREVDDRETAVLRTRFPWPALNTWHTYRIDVLPGSRVRFHWNGTRIFDTTDPAHAFSGGGPVGMRLDYFDTVLHETRVHRP
ncbi:hypothetical protein [Streptomyces poonensis]|uniref:Uncharacterized protein n=1 Tax=Streptomyces poonensis TaxID=68255 RepID=A0A918PE72_9ACTN|nr:hypothetical protein [Streptomyces poonensis]GGZ03207.1 hypothetical protein GCM10010365_22460 [Streptomyces poonensis]GLJ92966.1 hypothetical protein GCM10017589_55770 [Streptomyces poonensis]